MGRSKAKEILKKTAINPDTRVRDLTDDEISRLREVIDKEYKVEGDLRREVALNIKRLIEIGCYRGRRHRAGLPVRARGPRPTQGRGKAPRGLSVCSARNSEYRRLIIAWQLKLPGGELQGKEESARILSAARHISVPRSIIP